MKRFTDVSLYGTSNSGACLMAFWDAPTSSEYCWSPLPGDREQPLFRHYSGDNEVLLVRQIDKVVFGVYRSVTERRIKKCSLRDGKVVVKFQGKWREVEEINPHLVDRQRDLVAKLAQEKMKPYSGVRATVQFC